MDAQGSVLMNSASICVILLIFANLCFGLEPVLKLGARLITSLDIQFVRSSLDAFLNGEYFDIGSLCVRSDWHESNLRDHRITGRTRSEAVAIAAVVSTLVVRWN